jgi:hypothetical protein
VQEVEESQSKTNRPRSRQEEARKINNSWVNCYWEKTPPILYHILCHHSLAFETRPVNLIQRPMGWDNRQRQQQPFIFQIPELLGALAVIPSFSCSGGLPFGCITSLWKYGGCKWWPRKCLRLDVPNLIIFISKNGGKIPKYHKTEFPFFFFFHYLKEICQDATFRHQTKHWNVCRPFFLGGKILWATNFGKKNPFWNKNTGKKRQETWE